MTRHLDLTTHKLSHSAAQGSWMTEAGDVVHGGPDSKDKALDHGGPGREGQSPQGPQDHLEGLHFIEARRQTGATQMPS